MKTIEKNRKPKAGLLLVASPRFKNLGEGLSRGTYGERKAADVEQIIGKLDFLDLVYPGVVYEREDAVRSMDMFYAAKAIEVGLADSCGSLNFAVERANEINKQAIINQYINT